MNRYSAKEGKWKYQQGGGSGTNINLVSPQPFTYKANEVKFNPLTLTNDPIQINTTGITDQINKMRELQYKREELAFKYKELDFKEGKAYMDLMGDIFKGIGSASSTVDAMGGIAASPRYRDSVAAYHKKVNDLKELAARQAKSRNFEGFQKAAFELASYETSPEVTGLKSEIKHLNEIQKKLTEGAFGIGTMSMSDLLYGYLFDNANIKYQDLLKGGMELMSITTKSRDASDYLKRFEDDFKPQEVKSKGRATSLGTLEETISYVQRDVDKVTDGILNNMLSNVEGQAILNAQGFNFKTPTKEARDWVKKYVESQMERYKKPVSQYNTHTGNPMKDIDIIIDEQGDQWLKSTPKPGTQTDENGNPIKPTKPTETDKLVAARRQALEEQGIEWTSELEANARSMRNAADWNLFVEDYLRRTGGGNNQTTIDSKWEGFLPETHSLVSKLKDSSNTKVIYKEEDGLKIPYLVTSNNAVISEIERMREDKDGPSYKYSKKPVDTFWNDSDVRNFFKIKEKDWDTSAIDGPTHIYKLAPSSAVKQKATPKKQSGVQPVIPNSISTQISTEGATKRPWKLSE